MLGGVRSFLEQPEGQVQLLHDNKKVIIIMSQWDTLQFNGSTRDTARFLAKLIYIFCSTKFFVALNIY